MKSEVVNTIPEAFLKPTTPAWYISYMFMKKKM